jgi:hypothetical protein
MSLITNVNTLEQDSKEKISKDLEILKTNLAWASQDTYTHIL